ncbi:DUF3099 domain-containing protein [Streptomyces sp. NPDC101209]|uniref:DUF3099 domain-containing protein n=1 Tax=Streptomyces sp. NPDC101209 TaxID=3366129 RepID=UPI00380AF6F0
MTRTASAPPCITSAHTGLSEDVRARQRRYVTAMVVRTLCVLVMALTWDRWRILAISALVGGVVIPYVAVVAAQAGWRQQRGARPILTRTPPEPTARTLLEPTKILPPEHTTAP